MIKSELWLLWKFQTITWKKTGCVGSTYRCSMKVLKQWVINDLGEIGGLSTKWFRAGLHMWMELAGVSESYCWSCRWPLPNYGYYFQRLYEYSQFCAGWIKKVKHPIHSWYKISHRMHLRMRGKAEREHLFFHFQINGRLKLECFDILF